MENICKITEYIYKLPSPVGTLTVSCNKNSITGLWLEGQKYFGSTLTQDATDGADHTKHPAVIKSLKKWLDCYFAKTKPEFLPPMPPLAPAGSTFRQAVWNILCTIPYGKTITYGYIAAQLQKETGTKSSARAVGGAVGHNPISILVPCHRVLGASGALTGYAGGVDKKILLLQLEGIIT